MKDRAKGRQQQILLLTDGQTTAAAWQTPGTACASLRSRSTQSALVWRPARRRRTISNLIVANGGRAFLLDTIKPVPSSAALGPRGSVVQASFDRAQSFIKADDFDGAHASTRPHCRHSRTSRRLTTTSRSPWNSRTRFSAPTAHAQRYLDLEPNAFDRNEVAARIQALEQVQRERPHAVFDPGQWC